MQQQEALAGTSRAGRAALASLAGAVMDWYDFYAYGLVAAVAFPTLFFPSNNPATATLLTFATFGVGFLSRPLGGAVFGHYGDRIGRKAMLVLTLVMMGISTVAVGLMPTYAEIGVAAPVCLVVLRLVQGFALGGEWGGAALIAVEHAPTRRRGFFGSFVQVGASLGFLAATAVVSLCSTLTSRDQFLSWGWRIPFLLGALVVAGGYLVRRGVDETPEFMRKVERAHAQAKLPLVGALRRHPGAFLAIFGMRLSELVGFFTVTVFALNYAVARGIPRGELLNALLAIGLVAIFLIPACGALSDRIGRRSIYVVGAVVGIAGAFPLFWAIQDGSLLWITLAFVLVANLSHDPIVSVQQPLFVEMFEPEFRYSGAGVAYQLASAVAGGFTPFIAAWLSQQDNGGYELVALFLAAACAVSAVTAALYTGVRQDDPLHSPAAAPR